MKKSNKILLTIIIGFLIGAILLALIVRIKVVPQNVISFTSHSRSVGKIVTKSFEVDKFSKLEINGFAQLSIKTGDKPKVTVSTDEGYVANVDVSLAEDRLIINVGDGVGRGHDGKFEINIVTNQPLKKITTSGATNLNYVNIHGGELVLEVSGTSNCNLSGKLNILKIRTSGASYINAKNLVADDVTIHSSGASNITVHAKNNLKANLSGMANIGFYGQPENVERKISGMARLKSMED
ncbi:MAG: DUF2807 domain-containing protein [Gammaproteobacteria bacterium]|nr:DUF2807 domain-containing protein [Gammaproteobacteria bacterium]